MARIWDFQGIEHETVIQANLCSLFFSETDQQLARARYVFEYGFFRSESATNSPNFSELFTTRFLTIIYILHYHFLKLRSRSNTNS